MAKLAIESFWFVFTVVLPGLVTYTTFRILVGVLQVGADNELNVLPMLLDKVDQSETLSIGLLVSLGIVIQFFGIAVESLAFELGRRWGWGPYVHKDPKYQAAFDQKYEIIATMDPDKDIHVEAILGRFFMSHNIAIGMIINWLWLSAYLFVNWRFDGVGLAALSFATVITAFSVYVPCNRFRQSCRALRAHLDGLQAAGNP